MRKRDGLLVSTCNLVSRPTVSADSDSDMY